jgi:hypothetical protein
VLPPAFVSLFGLSGPALGTALTQVSGETATGSRQATFNAMGQFMGVLTDPFIAGRDGVEMAGGRAMPFAEESGEKGEGGTARDAYAMFAKAPLGKTYEPRWSV